MSEIVVTGLGVVSPLGNDTESFWRGLTDGRSAADRISLWDPSEHAVQIACEVRDFDAAEVMGSKEAVRADRHQRFAVVAADEAWRMARCDDLDVPPERIASFMSSSMGGFTSYEQDLANMFEGGPRRMSPMAAMRVMNNGAAGLIAMRHGILGPSLAVGSACATGTHAIGNAMLYLNAGMADVAVVGGAESAITPGWIASFGRAGALSKNNSDPKRASRPFDAARDGFVMSEGAGALILELREVAERRGVPILASVVGYGASSDAFHITQPHPEGIGAIHAMKMAMESGGVSPEDIDYVSAHGTSTPLNDRAETVAIKQALGPEAKRVAVSSIKGHLGHSLGAAGAFEAVATILAIHRGVIPPTINYEQADPDCDLDYVPEGAREGSIRVALSNSFGFGGHNACVAFKKSE